MGYKSLLSLVSPLKASFGFLMNTFRCRMRYCYVVRPPSSISFLWGIAKGFLHEDTAKKINILDTATIDQMLEYTNPSQLEVKFGGSRPNIEEFWPIKQVK